MEAEKTAGLIPSGDGISGAGTPCADTLCLEEPTESIPWDSANGSDALWQGSPYDHITCGCTPWWYIPCNNGAPWYAQFLVNVYAYETCVHSLCCLFRCPDGYQCCPCQKGNEEI
jgi:hypothetical protein